jgi:hypothetical protein
VQLVEGRGEFAYRLLDDGPVPYGGSAAGAMVTFSSIRPAEVPTGTPVPDGFSWVYVRNASRSATGSSTAFAISGSESGPLFHCEPAPPFLTCPVPSATSISSGLATPLVYVVPVGEDAAEAFYRIIDAADERRSIAVTNNIHPSGFDTIMPKTLAGASTDRLMHHAHLVATTGDSHRLAEALAARVRTHPSGRFLPGPGETRGSSRPLARVPCTGAA